MNPVGIISWVAVFIAFLGPLVAYPSMEILVLFMFLLGTAVALLTYNSGVNLEAVKLLLLSVLAVSIAPYSAYSSLMVYLRDVIILSAWYVAPIAVVQGWKSLVG